MLHGTSVSTLRRHTLSGIVSAFVNCVLLAASYPLYLRYLGVEYFGVWTVLVTVLNVAQIGNFGLGPAVTKLVAQAHAGGDVAGVIRLAATGVYLVIASGVLVCALLFVFRHAIIAGFGLEGNHAATAGRLLPYIGFLTIYMFAVQVFTATLAGLGSVDTANYIQTSGRAAAVILGVASLHAGHGLAGLLGANLASQAIMHLASVSYIRRIVPLTPALCLSFGRRELATLTKMGGAVFGGSVLQMFISPFNKLVLSRYVGLQAVTVYEIASNGAMQIRAMIEMGLRAMMPAISRAGAVRTTESVIQIRQVYTHSFRFAAIGGVIIYSVIFLFLGPFLRFWLGDRLPHGLYSAFVLLLISSLLSLLAVPAYYLLLGLGYAGRYFSAVAVLAGANAAFVTYYALQYKTISVGAVGCAVIASTALCSAYLFVTKASVLRKLSARIEEGDIFKSTRQPDPLAV